ncbi:hypothetical protein ACLMAB_01735 [Brevibacillus laterosporus]
MKKQGKSKVSQLLGFFGACACLLGLSGCGDQLLVEDINLALIYAMDRAPDKQMLVYEMSPVFNKDAKKNTLSMEQKHILFDKRRTCSTV